MKPLRWIQHHYDLTAAVFAVTCALTLAAVIAAVYGG